MVGTLALLCNAEKHIEVMLSFAQHPPSGIDLSQAISENLCFSICILDLGPFFIDHIISILVKFDHHGVRT